MKLRSTLALLFLLTTIEAAFGQTAGGIKGSVVDPTGASIPGAKVNLLLPGGKSAILSTETNANGLFDFTSVRPDLYVLEVEHAGFAKSTLQNLKVDPVRVTEIAPVKLEIVSTSQTVEVSAAVQTIQTNSFEIASTVTQDQVINLPVLDRQVNNLFYTQAGVNTNSRTTTVINGLRAQNSSVTYEGINVQDNFIRVNGLDYIPNKLTIGEVQELTVSSSNANPSIGGNASTITLVAPSGGNTLHGSAYWYNRNNAVSANDWFSNKNGVENAQLNLNQFGGGVSGPIKKDKLFFFTNYETYNLHATSPQTNTILTPSARQGILTYKVGGATRTFNLLQVPCVGLPECDTPLKADSVMAALIAKMPSTGNSDAVGDGLNTTGYSFNQRSNVRRDSIVGKVDYNLSTRHVIAGTFRWNRDNVDRPASTGVGNSYDVIPPVVNTNGAKLFSVAYRWSPGATLTNELRFGGNLARAPFDVAGDLPTSIVSNVSPFLAFTSPQNNFLPQGRDVKTYNIQDNANWLKGRHTVAFGFQSQLSSVKSYGFGGIVPVLTIGYSPTNPYGYGVGDIPGASATDVNTANNVLASVAGIINNATQSFNVTSQNSGFVAGAPLIQNLRLNNHAAYVADTWKFNKRLTLIGGVRWEYFSPVSERDGLLIQPTLINNNPVQTLTGNASLNFAGNNLYNKDLNNFAPNVGFAWDVFGTGRTVLRGGYSIHFTNADVLEAVLNTVTVNSGLVGTTTLNNLNGFVASAPKLTAPAFKIPITTAENFVNTGGQAVQGLIDPNLQTPYAQQYSFGIQQRIGSVTVEARFVGTHSVKDLRQIDFNQINVNQAGFLQDFKNARNNGLLASAAGLGFDPRYNAAVAGSVQLPFFNSLPSAGLLTNAAVRTPILQNQIGSLAQTYQGAGFFPTNIPGFSYFPNRNTLYSSELTNLTSSNYNGLQLEARRAVRGMQFQVSYAFSKALSDTSVIRGLDAQLDNNNHAVERARAPWDLTNAIKATHYIPLPFGPGHRLNSPNGVVNKLIGGWALSGFLNIQNGSPISFLSARGTLNRAARSAQNTVDTNLNLDGLKAITGLYKTGNGVYFVDPARIGPNGAGVAADGAAPFAGQAFFNPGAGTVGSLQRRILNSPWVNDYNVALVKETKVSERLNVQFRADFYNVFNHPTFAAGEPAGAPTDYNINSLNFGKITTQYYSADGIGPRVVQFGLLVKF